MAIKRVLARLALGKWPIISAADDACAKKRARRLAFSFTSRIVSAHHQTIGVQAGPPIFCLHLTYTTVISITMLFLRRRAANCSSSPRNFNPAKKCQRTSANGVLIRKTNNLVYLGICTSVYNNEPCRIDVQSSVIRSGKCD